VGDIALVTTDETVVLDALLLAGNEGSGADVEAQYCGRYSSPVPCRVVAVVEHVVATLGAELLATCTICVSF
jgi:hypothetical protein